MAQPGPRQYHPKDKALLKPLNALGKPASASEQVSFLRRTEYTASSGPQMMASGSSKDLLRLRNDPRRNMKARDKDDPINILKHIVKGFDVAYPKDAYKGDDSADNIKGAQVTNDDIKAWAKPRHPTNPDLELLDEYPVLPDLDALPQSGYYVVVKFISNPVGDTQQYDTRLDTAILLPKEDAEREAVFKQKEDEWNEQSGKPRPMREFDYDYYLPEEVDAVRGLKRKLDVNDPQNEDEELYTDMNAAGARNFSFKRLRAYETYTQVGDADNFYNNSIAMALHDPDTEVGAAEGTNHRLNKGAYFYPVIQRTAIRPKRKVGMAFDDAEGRVDGLEVRIREMDDEEKANQQSVKASFDPSLQVEAAAA